MAEDLPAPQFPAPGWTQEPDSGDTSLPTPSKAAQQLIRRHLSEHGIRRFRLADHVYLGGPRAAGQHITWHPDKAAFSCDLCPGFVFGTGEVTDEMVERAQLFDPNLQPHLAGLHTLEEREEMTRLYLSGALNQERLAAAGENAYRAAAARSRPQVAGRRERLQEWMLDRYSELGVVAQVTTAAEALQRTDPALWKEMVGRPLAGSTITKNYWNPIRSSRKFAAKQRFERSRSAREA